MREHLHRPSRRGLLCLMGAAMLWPRPGRAEGLETLSGLAFGTTWSVIGRSGAGIGVLRSDIEALFAKIDRSMSPWRRDGDLSRFNDGPAGWHPADAELAHVTRAAIELSELSRGAFDPTVGPLVARWGFGPIEGGDSPDWRGLSVEKGRIAKARDDLTLDLCGIAKGRALDLAVDLAAGSGFEDLLFDFGGELRVLGRHPAGRSWRVAVQDPSSGADPAAYLRLPAGRAVATSGLQTQSYTLDGHTYGHIIDPVTGSPADKGLLSVSVVAEDAMTADGWATALFSAGATAGPALARERGIAALFLAGGGPSPRRIGTGGIEGLLL